MNRALTSAVVLLAGWSLAAPAGAAEVQVAVASNFSAPMEQIAADFARTTGHHAVVATGATGTFFAQIESGAPFEVLLAADETTPEKLESDGFAVPGSRFVYAIGTLVLWTARPGSVDAGGDVLAILKNGGFQHLAVANPKLAPYGTAAMETLAALGLADVVRAKIVQGANIAQTYQFVATGNAELGFVALSQVEVPGRVPRGSYWVVPGALHAPLRQGAVLLRKGASSPAARALCDYLKTVAAEDVLRAYGYGVPR